MTELPVPPDAGAATEARELLRAWLIDDTLQCSLHPDVFEEPATWGAVLADLARYVARALHEDDPGAAPATLRQIRDAFAAELRGGEGEEEHSPHSPPLAEESAP